MNAKISVFVTYFEAIIYLPLYNLHNCTFKSLFSLFADVFMSCATLKRDVSSARNFALEDKSPEKLLLI